VIGDPPPLFATLLGTPLESEVVDQLKAVLGGCLQINPSILASDCRWPAGVMVLSEVDTDRLIMGSGE